MTWNLGERGEYQSQVSYVPLIGGDVGNLSKPLVQTKSFERLPRCEHSVRSTSLVFGTLSNLPNTQVKTHGRK